MPESSTRMKSSLIRRPPRRVSDKGLCVGHLSYPRLQGPAVYVVLGWSFLADQCAGAIIGMD